MISRTIRGAGVDLAAWELGPAGAPTIVLVHGYPDTHAAWDDVALDLARNYHVVSYDVRGAGASDAPKDRESYRIEALTQDLAAIALEAGAGKKVHLVGHDWGGIQAWDAVSDPKVAQYFASFTTLSGPCLDHVGAMLRSPRDRGFRKIAVQATRSWYVYAIHVPGLMPFFWRRGLGDIWSNYLAKSEALAEPPLLEKTLVDDAIQGVELYRANIFQRVLEPRERRVNIPVQIVAPLGDRYVSPYLSEGLERWIPRLWRRKVPGPHWIIRRHPQRVARWISELIEHVEGAVEAPALRRCRLPRSKPLDGAVAVITGESREIKLAFAERGAEVVEAEHDRAPDIFVDAAPIGLQASREQVQKMIDRGEGGHLVFVGTPDAERLRGELAAEGIAVTTLPAQPRERVTRTILEAVTKEEV